VLIADLPAEAYGEVANAFKAAPGSTGGIKPESIETAAGLAYYTVENGKDGATSVRRYSMILPGPTFSGYVAVQVPENAARIYTDDAVRQMFASAVIRNEVPIEEQLGLMPFKISELSNFKNIRTLAPGAALILSDGDEKTGFEAAPFMIIGLIGSTAARPMIAAASPSRLRPPFPACATAGSRCRSRSASTASPATRRGSTPPAARTIRRSPSCSGCGSAPRPRCASSALRRATTGPRPFRASARCATEFIRAADVRNSQGPPKTSGFRSYTNGTSFSPSGS
jgi:hypothetical protein